MINWNQSNHSFIPGLPHSFHRLQYGNARRAWYIVSHGHDVSDKVTKAKFRAFFKPTTCLTLVVNDSSGGIFALPSFLSPHHSYEIVYHDSHWFSVLQAMTSWADKGNESNGCGNGCRVRLSTDPETIHMYPWNSSTRNYVIYVMLAKSCFETHLVLKFILLRSIMLSHYLNSHTCWTGTSKSEATYW